MVSELPIVVIYKKPLDYPDSWVARLFLNDRATHQFCVSDDYDGTITWMEGILRERGNDAPHRMPRLNNDDPMIWECWL
jgi:hypothetical protein